MQTYHINHKKQKKALKNYMKAEVKGASSFVRFCYALTILFRVLAVVLGIANVVYCAVWSNYPFIDLLYLTLTVILPYALSYIPNAVCIMSVGGEYRLRRQETICLLNNGFSYSYHDDRDLFSDSVFGFDVLYENVRNVEYNEKTKLLTVYGDIPADTYVKGERTETDVYSQVSFLNVYDIDIRELLKTKR